MRRTPSRRRLGDSLDILPEISPARRALAWACNRREQPDGGHRPHTATSAPSAQRATSDPAPSRRCRLFQSLWTQTGFSWPFDTEAPTALLLEATSPPSSCARSPPLDA